jgi:tetratricopeptide (TPR) repeat protein
MSLRPGATTRDGQPQTIVYEDARQRLRAARLINLEDAVLTCCRWNDPECGSIEHVLGELFLEMRKHLYQRAHAENDPQKLSQLLLTRLEKGIAAWRSPHSQPDDCRSAIMKELPGSVPDLLDPLDYVPRLLEHKRHLPEVMIGCAHGDLHGRNVLIGTDQDKATFAAVFDYEDMGTDLVVGWDLVKLETELKVRAYEKVFPGEESDFIQSVYQFEQRLAADTVKRSKSLTWGLATSREKSDDRLFAMLVALRSRAKECLAFEPRRSHSWLHEYNFLLAAYGLYVGKFEENYGRRQFLSAFISAAVAGEQHAWAKNAGSGVIERAAARAKLAIQEQRSDEHPDAGDAESYHVPFAFAKEFSRSRQSRFIAASIEILNALCDKFPYVLILWQELALAHLELLDLTRDEQHLQEAKRTLLQLDTLYPRRKHDETLCRQGRLWKDCGDYSFDRGDSQTAIADYRLAMEAYRSAYERSRNYYPGINLATLCLLAGSADMSTRLAKEILNALDGAEPASDEDLTWVLATKAEANLLLGNYDEAILFYEQAVGRSGCTPHNRSAMLKQVKRILRVKPCTEPGRDQSRFESIFE